MSTIQQYDHVSFEATNVVDGSKSQDVNHCNCCASTASTTESLWLQITLNEMHLVQFMEVYGRNDECRAFFFNLRKILENLSRPKTCHNRFNKQILFALKKGTVFIFCHELYQFCLNLRFLITT